MGYSIGAFNRQPKGLIFVHFVSELCKWHGYDRSWRHAGRKKSVKNPGARIVQRTRM